MRRRARRADARASNGRNARNVHAPTLILYLTGSSTCIDPFLYIMQNRIQDAFLKVNKDTKLSTYALGAITMLTSNDSHA